MDQANDPLPSSPTISSLSSSDLDTESTGSFFPDRSTTLGTLMGVNFPSISFRVPSHRETAASFITDNGNPSGRRSKKPTERRRHHGRRWWQLCRDDTRAPSLGDFLEIERRFGDGPENRFLYGGPVELGPVPPSGNGALFADGRVLPPSAATQSPAGALCRMPVLFNGICCGGGG